jgi:hypothetical protein
LAQKCTLAAGEYNCLGLKLRPQAIKTLYKVSCRTLNLEMFLMVGLAWLGLPLFFHLNFFFCYAFMCLFCSNIVYDLPNCSYTIKNKDIFTTLNKPFLRKITFALSKNRCI